MRILVLNYEFPPVGGGGGRVAAEVGARLAIRGHQVAVLTSHFGDLPHEERDGMTIWRVRCGRQRADRCSVPEMARFVVASALPALRRVLEWKPSVVHAHFAVPTGATAWMASVITGIPYLLSTQLGDVPGGVPEQTNHLFRVLKPLTVPIWRRAAAVTAPSQFVAELGRRAYGITPHVIHNGIDLSSYCVRTRAPSYPTRLVWVGRMQDQKNLPFGLRRLAEMSALCWTLDVVGDGPQRGEAERAVREGGIEDRVSFVGWREEKQVLEFMQRADVLYLPSRSEGLSLVSLQALACGLAIVGSRVGGVEDVVDDGINGYLCPLDDPPAFRRALRRVITDQPLLQRMQQASLRYAGRFSLERSVEQFEALLEQVARRQPGRRA